MRNEGKQQIAFWCERLTCYTSPKAFSKYTSHDDSNLSSWWQLVDEPACLHLPSDLPDAESAPRAADAAEEQPPEALHLRRHLR